MYVIVLPYYRSNCRQLLKTTPTNPTGKFVTSVTFNAAQRITSIASTYIVTAVFITMLRQAAQTHKHIQTHTHSHTQRQWKNSIKFHTSQLKQCKRLSLNKRRPSQTMRQSDCSD